MGALAGIYHLQGESALAPPMRIPRGGEIESYALSFPLGSGSDEQRSTLVLIQFDITDRHSWQKR
jgi:hypothetical protein